MTLCDLVDLRLILTFVSAQIKSNFSIPWEMDWFKSSTFCFYFNLDVQLFVLFRVLLHYSVNFCSNRSDSIWLCFIRLFLNCFASVLTFFTFSLQFVNCFAFVLTFFLHFRFCFDLFRFFFEFLPCFASVNARWNFWHDLFLVVLLLLFLFLSLAVKFFCLIYFDLFRYYFLIFLFACWNFGYFLFWFEILFCYGW